MNIKSTSRICGILYVSTVLAFLVSKMFVIERLVDAGNISETFRSLAENATRYRWAVSIDFLAMVAVMVLVFSLFAILKPVHAYLALVALGLRIGEVVIQASSKIPDFLLLKLSQTAVSFPGGSSADMIQLGQMLIDGSTQALWISFVFLGIGSLFNNFLFYKSKGIPDALAVLGILSAALYTLGSVTALIIDLPEFANMGMMLPMVLFELLLGFYLAIFGMKEKAV